MNIQVMAATLVVLALVLCLLAAIEEENQTPRRRGVLPGHSRTTVLRQAIALRRFGYFRQTRLLGTSRGWRSARRVEKFQQATGPGAEFTPIT